MSNNSPVYIENREPPEGLYKRILMRISFEEKRGIFARRFINWSSLPLSLAALVFCLSRLIVQLSKTSIIYFIKILLTNIASTPSIIGDASLAIFESLSGTTMAGVSLFSILVLLILLQFGTKKRIIQMKF
jgi:hypothetical protein